MEHIPWQDGPQDAPGALRPPSAPQPPSMPPPYSGNAPTAPPPSFPAAVPAESGRSKGCLIAGIVVGAGLLVVGALVLGVLWFLGFQQSQAELAVPSTAQFGECFHLDNANQQPVPCSEVHHYEVYSLIVFDDSEPYPSRIERWAGAVICEEDFEWFTGEDYYESDLDYSIGYPTEEAWEAGDRNAVCALHDITLSPLIGSKAAN